MKNKCKYCNKKGLYSFGWLNTKGEWQSKHLTCKTHAAISMIKQQHECLMEQMRERAKDFGKERTMLFYGINSV